MCRCSHRSTCAVGDCPGAGVGVDSEDMEEGHAAEDEKDKAGSHYCEFLAPIEIPFYIVSRIETPL